MFINNYTLKIGNRILLENTNLDFEEGEINPLLGRNGSGKSQLAKDFIINRGNYFSNDIYEDTLIISSYSNLPSDVTINDLERTIPWKLSKEIYQLLNINQISKTVKLKQLSDGQKQKVKLLVLLSLDKHIIILDEITNALDKKSVDEINVFLQNYIQYYPEKIIINISHDINNIRSLKGNYFLIDNQKICKVDTLDDAISWYLGE
ncbi:TPA: ATP-binding cassette domain-containing protein [Streptococcus agalactiae]|uniref:ATP-binding cassette domain-containing protein n=1 Tax=Streptococcus agalactiae TaxID=1311 RepID=UPI000B6BA2BA|nr:ABC transporter ATP-binding protein [Streptococcus agalactiae]MCP9190773.1 ABC transporter ATP-binding protein [Streptococcus agalactiae]OTG56211.1 peptide ABC transporter ATP-binding protein [Streptococcus agalactiae]RRA73025.1 ATP-binding cassette domain-containing protein [Streptococcus agalactiae]RRA78205.1 ATP-binding cassette domain-containing protein [Streptococcus agalactiae]RRA79584.1 ATP-binding cassette domain-containing protein [Streptococcus agalactiae]